MLDDYTFQKELINHQVYPAWQFIVNARKNIEVAQYCTDVIESVIEKMKNKTVRWEEDLFSDFVEVETDDGRKGRQITVTTDNIVSYEVHVAGVITDPIFLVNKLIRDFYQYVRNTFDSIGQIANSGLLANKGKKIDKTDFPAMVREFSRVTYTRDFPLTAGWFASIKSSPEFSYIDAINNRTKHTADVSSKLAMGILGSSNIAKIKPFFRNNTQHGDYDLSDQLHATMDFVNQSYLDFISAFTAEFVNDKYVDGRRNTIGGVYQQHMKNEPDSDFSYAYILEETDFFSMPDDIYVLLVNEQNGTIYCHDCPFDTLLVKGEGEHNIVGRYQAEEMVGDDCIVRYRHYKKDTMITGLICMLYEMQQTEKKFYHRNPHFEITSISDDDAFLNRVSLPF